jgi:O-antigen ligase
VFESLIWLVPLAIVLAGLRWPRAGLLIFAATLPLFGAPPGGPYLAALDMSALAAIATGLRGGAARRSRNSEERRSSLDIGVLAVLAVTLASAFPLAYRPPSWSPGALADLMAFLPSVERWTILYTWRAVANMLLGVGLYLAVKRAFAGSSVGILGRALGAGLLAALGIGFLEFSGWLDLWSFRPVGLPLFDERFHSFFFHSGWMAEFVILSTPFAAVALASRKGLWRVLGFAVVSMALGAVLFSGQRGAWFAALAQLVVALVLLWRDRRPDQHRVRFALVAMTTVTVLVGGIVLLRPEVGASLRDRLGDAVSNLSNRTAIWKVATDMASERPLLGWGVGSFSPVFDFEITEGSSPGAVRGHVLGHHSGWLTAHNTYLMFLAERGGLGLASLLLLGWLAVHAIWRATRVADEETGALAAALLVCVSGFAVYGLVQYLFFPRANALLIWMLLGAVATLDAGSRRRRSERIGLALVAIALVLLPLRALFWEKPPSRGDRSFGFHAAEVGDGASYQ